MSSMELVWARSSPTSPDKGRRTESNNESSVGSAMAFHNPRAQRHASAVVAERLLGTRVEVELLKTAHTVCRRNENSSGLSFEPGHGGKQLYLSDPRSEAHGNQQCRHDFPKHFFSGGGEGVRIPMGATESMGRLVTKLPARSSR